MRIITAAIGLLCVVVLWSATRPRWLAVVLALLPTPGLYLCASWLLREAGHVALWHVGLAGAALLFAGAPSASRSA